MAKRFTVQSLLDEGQKVVGLLVRGSGVQGRISFINEIGSVFIQNNPTAYDAHYLYLAPRKVLK